MDSSLINQGINLMLFGMGTVFIFLTVLIFATTGMSKFVNYFFPEKVITPKARKKTTNKKAAIVAPATLHIIQRAIDKHRAR